MKTANVSGLTPGFIAAGPADCPAHHQLAGHHTQPIFRQKFPFSGSYNVCMYIHANPCAPRLHTAKKSPDDSLILLRRKLCSKRPRNKCSEERLVFSYTDRQTDKVICNCRFLPLKTGKIFHNMNGYLFLLKWLRVVVDKIINHIKN